MKKKSILAIVATIIVLVVATSGCIDNVESIEDEYIFIDPSNGVMYGLTNFAGPNLDIYSLVNADGTPKVLDDPLQYFFINKDRVYYISNDITRSGYKVKCYVDKDTGVMYLRIATTIMMFLDIDDVVIMLNPDGTPKTNSDHKYYGSIMLQDEENANMFVDNETGVVYLKLHGTVIPMVDQYGNYKTIDI